MGPAMPFTEQFCPTYPHMVWRELVASTIRKFLIVSDELPLIIITSVIREKISPKSRNVSALRFITSIDGRFLRIHLA